MGLTRGCLNHVSKILITGGSGYIGSVLHRHLIEAEHAVAIVDPDVGDTLSVRRYQEVEDWQLQRFDAVIHLAAHSSVAACDADPEGAFANNVAGVVDLISKLRHGQTFIFASTGSLHDINASRVYDRTKRQAETMILCNYPTAHILRLGTVCGVSPAMREDLILNGMTRDAVRKGVIRVTNPHAWRPVLFFPDLLAAVDGVLSGGALVGIHGLASFQARIGSWADMVAKVTGAEIDDVGLSPHYDFRMPLPSSVTTPEAVIGELAEYWRRVKTTWRPT